MDIVETKDSVLVAAAADLWLSADAARAGGAFDAAYVEEQRMGFIHAVARPEAWLAVVDEGDHPAGLVGGFAGADDVGNPTPGVSYLAWVAVVPSRWGSGIGSALVAYAECRSTEAPDAALRLWVHDSNERARALYERRGWSVTGNSTRIPTSGELLLEYRLELL